ncbi:DNA-binding protein WhiA [Metamycoplasma phocicerebrale]|uniref:Probable cell division protein WhiA n=1 Tax=Metamycoplasma phocicerebrale TaxID=142649 RepID=A0A3T0TU41_9BACT|nr:DNA-binding protein WhiA [Metamycoplasma phocicerebrale]AZZ65627.1 DNA-binding protein WhiA [Metamycoplasma phocicerebrale]
MKNKTFTLTIKEEIIRRPLKKQEKLNLLSGIFATSKIDNENYLLIFNNKELFNFIIELLKEFNVEFYNERKNELLIKIKSFNNPKLKMERDYFSGIFLSSGSVSDFKTSFNHLELKFYNHDKAIESVDILNKYNLNFKIIVRQNRYIIYIKKIENICDFLKAIEAINSYFKLEEYKIERDYFNNINRITNFDIYNQQRIANANTLFLENFDFIIKNKLTSYFSKEEIKFFKLKKKNLDSSLSDLVTLLTNENIIKSKSSLNHALIKLKKIVEKYKKI